MKVRDLIEQLSKLNQDTDIWVMYDYCYALDVDVEVATAEEVEYVSKHKIKEGDYIIKANS